MAKQPAQSFRDLGVWQKSHALVLEVYGLTRRLPKEELFGLVSQMRRVGFGPGQHCRGVQAAWKGGQGTPAEHRAGSLEELRYFFILCADLSYLPSDAVGDRLDEVARMLGSYTQAIQDSRSQI